MKTQLTPDQSTALNLLLEFPPTFILQGYAGTGKTFLLKEFIEKAETEYGYNVILTATTHKAVSVAGGDGTIHSYLGLTLDRKDDKYVLSERGGDKPVSENDLVIIDEASMISSDVLKFILKAQKTYNLTLIFVGDPAQLPPVKEETSPVWDLDAPSFTLTEIVRQAADSNIIKLSTLIRGNSYSRQDILNLSNGTDLITGTIADAQKFFNETYSQTGDFPQIISFRNTVVNELNTWARRQIVGPTPEKYLPGEKLYIRSSYKDSKFRLEDIVEIESIGASKPHSMRFDLPVNTTELTVSNGAISAEILVPVTPRDMSNFTSNKNNLAKACKKKNASWKQFWDYTESLIEVKHIYAMTCHRSQGSTFPITIVNKTDISENRLFYTAVTRASKQVFIAL